MIVYVYIHICTYMYVCSAILLWIMSMLSSTEHTHAIRTEFVKYSVMQQTLPKVASALSRGGGDAFVMYRCGAPGCVPGVSRYKKLCVH